jgi:energy-coupling factor transport system ATP-binding protein
MKLQLENISYTYKTRIGVAPPLFNGLELTVASGECVGVMGPEGAGKTTLLFLLDGLLRPSAGKVIIDGEDIWISNKRLREHRRRVGFSFQFPEQQFFCESVGKEITFGLRNFGLLDETSEDRCFRTLERVGLSEAIMDRSPFSLSMGEARKVALASLLAMEPSALLLDEPTAGLDANGMAFLLSQCASLRQRHTTIVVASHDIDFLAEVCSRIIMMDEGRIVFDGTMVELLEKPEVLSTYGYDVPAVTQFMCELSDKGYDVDRKCHTLEEARRLLRLPRPD